MRRCGLVVIIGALLTAATAAAQTPTPRPVPPQEYVFPAGAGAIFLHVRPDRTQDFEAVIARLSHALDQTTDPVRKQQAASWRIYKSVETPRESVIYVFFFDPASFGADYDPIKILSEALPGEVQGLYERLKADVMRVERMGLSKIR
jgi:hypothetical protein